ncbi:hypothetical protein [Bradyrhizobium sp. cf659]|uniref:hypothetical protein n=1 Tax=Bradyrhizobium sp. cf659 TaxID=1761771 RepID=UPI0008E93F2A|nr:hypothetical protein [Bradyrhizobium sp. cf659]SFJ29113.1 hypothetical protein SAMN04487925_106147 [Bradyrhizobium sp. cf659]
MRRRNPIKKLEASELVLARMREDRARLDAEIASLEQRHEADVQQFVIEAVKRLNLTQVPAASLLAGLEQLAQGAGVDRPVFDPGGVSADAGPSNDPRQELVEVFVRLSRNASAANRDILTREGCHWNGRSAGWSGRVTAEALQRLRAAFPGRVEGPDGESSATRPEGNAGPEVEADAPPLASPEVPPANMEAAAVAPAEDRVAPQTMNMETEVPPAQPAVSAATRLVASPYRSTLPRRPLPT